MTGAGAYSHPGADAYPGADDGLSRLTLLAQFDEPDAPLRDRLDRAVAQLTPEEAGAVIVRSGPVTLADGSEAERAADPEVHSDTAALYLSDIVGVRERLDGDATEVSGVEAVDERTVRITIDAPKEYFLSKLAYPSSAVVDRLAVEALGDEWWMSDDVNGSPARTGSCGGTRRSSSSNGSTTTTRRSRSST